MKKKFKTAGLAVIVACACILPQEMMAAITFTNALMINSTLLVADEVPVGHLQHDITFNQAALLLQNLLSNPSFYGKAKNYGYSGFLSKQTLNDIIPRGVGNPNTSGLLVYLCYDKGAENDTTDDEIFLAFKRGTGFTEDMKQPVLDSNDVLYKTKFAITYDGYFRPSIELAKEELIKFIETDSSQNDTIMGSTANKFSNEFKVSFKAEDDISRVEVDCNNYNFGFIPLSELDFLRFPEGVAQSEITGVRFYLGFDNTENDNRLRVFFVAAKENKNIIIKTGDVNKTQYARIIERSRP